MWEDAHGFDYNQQDRCVFYEHKCNFRIALMYFREFLVPSPPPLILKSVGNEDNNINDVQSAFDFE